MTVTRKKLSRVAILALKGMDRDTKLSLAKMLGYTEAWFYKMIRENSENLTKAMVLEFIGACTGLQSDQLLEDIENKDISELGKTKAN